MNIHEDTRRWTTLMAGVFASGRAVAQAGGMYRGTAQFPAVGDYWITITLTRGGQSASVRYSIYVKPAQ